MNHHQIDFRKVGHFVLIITFLIALLILAKQVLIPLVFAFIFSLVLKPMTDFFIRFVRWRWAAILLSFIAVFIPVAAGLTLFIIQLKGVLDDVSLITERVEIAVNDVFEKVNNVLPISREKGVDWLSKNMTTLIDQPFEFLSSGLSTSTSIIAGFLLMLLYTFFFLFYQKGFNSFVLQQVQKKHRENVKGVVSDIQSVSQHYLYGLAAVIIIVGLMNSVGLMIIGIEYAFFWGFLASVLAIIPYVGTFIGGLLPLLYSFAVTDTMWQPLSIIGLFVFVQTLEGNLITPKIVGGSVKVNPFAAVLALIIGGAIWGIAGMILALPYIAIFKVVCDNIDVLKPVGFLLSSDLFDNPDKFREEWDSDRYKLISLFEKKPS